MTREERVQAIHAACHAWDRAEREWVAGYTSICPRNVWPGDFRHYPEATSGELRPLFERFQQCRERWISLCDDAKNLAA